MKCVVAEALTFMTILTFARESKPKSGNALAGSEFFDFAGTTDIWLHL